MQQQSQNLVLEDVLRRFLVNLPPAETTNDRLCLHLKEAHWFYCDFYCEQFPWLPRLGLRQFAESMLSLRPARNVFRAAVQGQDMPSSSSSTYKRSTVVHNCGALAFNEDMTKVLMIQPWTGQRWCFPTGQMRPGDKIQACAVWHLAEKCGLVADKYLTDQSFTIREDNQDVTICVFLGVPENTVFLPLARKEVRAVEWQEINELPYINGRGSPCKRQAYKYLHSKDFFLQVMEWLLEYKPEYPQVTAQPSVCLRNQTPQDAIAPLPSFETNILAALTARGAKVAANQISNNTKLRDVRPVHNANTAATPQVPKAPHSVPNASSGHKSAPSEVLGGSTEVMVEKPGSTFTFKLNTAEILSCFD